jgi:hypothetical protein
VFRRPARRVIIPLDDNEDYRPPKAPWCRRQTTGNTPETRGQKMRTTLFATVAAFGLAFAAPAFAHPAQTFASGGDYVVTNQQNADAGDYVVTNQQFAEVDNGLWQENQANQQTADAGDYVVTNQQNA